MLDAEVIVVAGGVAALLVFAVALAWWLWRRPPQARSSRPSTPPTQSRAAACQQLREAAQAAADRGDLEVLERAYATANESSLSREEFPQYQWAEQLHALRARAGWAARAIVGEFEGVPVYRDDSASVKRDGDAGRLVFTERSLIYVGDVRIELPWSDVYHAALGDDDRGGPYIAFQRRGKTSATRFYFLLEALAAGAFALSECLVRHAGEARAVDSGEVSSASEATQNADDDDLDFETDVVGESHDDRQEHLWAVTRRAGQHPRDGVRFTARLLPEPGNPYDGNAVAVTDADTGHMLGYLSRALAREYQPAVAAMVTTGGSADVPALVRGGREAGHSLGVWLDMTAFNATAGLRPPEDFLQGPGRVERAIAAGTVEGVTWFVHRSHAIEAAALGDHDAAAASFEKALRGWFAWLAFEGRAPTPATLIEEYARWARKAGRQDIELEVLRRYARDVGPHELESTRHGRLSKRLAVVQAAAVDEAPF